MARTQLRGWTKPVIRRDRPAVMVGQAEVKNLLPTMIIHLDATEAGVFRSLRDYCGNPKHPIGYEELDTCCYVVCGLPQDLLDLTGRWWVKDWWWDHDTRVVGGSGHGERPKRKNKSIQQMKADDKNSKKAMTPIR